MSAELCSVADELGTVEAGKIADLIVVDGNPLDDLANLQNVQLVIKEGQVLVDKRG
jgi:imidazolonepropionase-like amidohydrolase